LRHEKEINPELIKKLSYFMELKASVLSLQEPISLSQINPTQNSPHPAFLGV
jgi:hypothetical protein